MKTIGTVLRQTVVLIVLGVLVGLGVNAVRGKDRIHLTRDYTPTVPPLTQPTGPSGPVEPAEPYQVMDVAEVARIAEDLGRRGVDLIVDARRENVYAEGHIPGALQCDPYNLEAHINEVYGMAMAAERVIVYCNGGKCEDSLLLCQELELRGIPKQQIYVFKAGWEGWEAYLKEHAATTTAPAGSPQPAAANDGAQPRPSAPPASAAADQPAAALQGYQVVNLEHAVAMFQDPRTENGTYVFVDARADEPYEAGHIPGAVQCDYYRIDYYFPELMHVAANAERIVVYCNGGDCEDSLYVCGELLKADVPRAHIVLFKGGWQEWTKGGMPVETGRK